MSADSSFSAPLYISTPEASSVKNLSFCHLSEVQRVAFGACGSGLYFFEIFYIFDIWKKEWRAQALGSLSFSAAASWEVGVDLLLLLFLLFLLSVGEARGCGGRWSVTTLPVLLSCARQHWQHTFWDLKSHGPLVFGWAQQSRFSPSDRESCILSGKIRLYSPSCPEFQQQYSQGTSWSGSCSCNAVSMVQVNSTKRGFLILSGEFCHLCHYRVTLTRLLVLSQQRLPCTCSPWCMGMYSPRAGKFKRYLTCVLFQSLSCFMLLIFLQQFLRRKVSHVWFSIPLQRGAMYFPQVIALFLSPVWLWFSAGWGSKGGLV